MSEGEPGWATPAPSGARLPFTRIFVTGAGGFVGRQLVKVLGERIGPTATIVLAAHSVEGAHVASHERIAFDLEDPTSIADAIRTVRPDLVIHLAAQSSVGRSVDAAARTWSVNLAGSLTLARAIADSAPECTLLFPSSVEVYGLTFNHETASEISPLRPQSAYARSKAAAELMFADVLPRSARLIVVRPSNHSGPGQDEAFVIPAFAAQIARAEREGLSSIRVGNLEAERDFLDVRDVIAAYMALLEQVDMLPQRSTFNIASGTPIRIDTILEKLRALSIASSAVEQDPDRMRPSEVERTVIDVSAIREAIGWHPIHGVDDMLASVLQHQRARQDI